MLKRYFSFCLLVSCAPVFFSGPVHGANTPEGFPIYVTGDFSEPTWNPGTGAAPGGTAEDLRLFDDGTSNGDEVADDGLWTCVVTGLVPWDEIDWKIASPGWSPVNVPTSSPENLRAIVPDSGTVAFYLDTNPKNDGLIPDVGLPNQHGFAYTPSVWEYVKMMGTISLSGSFQTQLGGESDWEPTDDTSQIILTDDGTGMDETAGDGIYTGSVTGLAAGSYEYKGVIDFEDWDWPKFTSMGFSQGGGNLRFAVIDSSDVIVFQLDARTARLGAVSASLSFGPPFFAQSAAWGEGFSELEDLGNEVSGAYRKVFTVNEPGTYTFRIRDRALREYPLSGDYPFTTTKSNQEVLVIFDRNEYGDGYEPSTNIVLIVDNATKVPLNQWEYVQPVGDWMIDFGGVSDWNADDVAFMAFDEGDPLDGDAVAGDGIYTIRLETAVSASNRSLKAVGRREGLEDGPWTIQIGGPGEGVTFETTNTNIPFSYTQGVYTFQIDTLTGRVGVGDTPPQRPSLEEPVKVQSWSVF